MSEENKAEQEDFTDQVNLEIRFRKLKAQKEDLEQELARLNKSYLKRSEKYENENKDLRNQMKDLNLFHESEKVLFSNGVVDEDVIDFIKFKYSKEPSDGEAGKPSFSDFFSSFKETSSFLNKVNKEEAVSDVSEDIVNESQPSLKPETPVKDSSFHGTMADGSLSSKSVSPRDFAKLSVEEQDQMFVSMGLKR